MDLPTQSDFANARDEYLDHLRYVRGASEHTIAAYRRDLTSAFWFLTEAGYERIEEVTPGAILRYESSLGLPLAVRTRQRRLSALRSCLTYWVKRGRLSELPWPEVGRVRKPRHLPRALPPETLQALLESPDLNTPAGLRDRALLELLYGAGLRISEALSLTVADWEQETSALRVTGKRGKTRFVPLPPITAQWVNRYLREARPRLVKKALGPLFLGVRGGALSRQSAFHIVDKHRRRAGIALEVSPHILRHTYAVHLLRGGADLRAVQELLGHASVESTAIYTQLDLDHVREQFRRSHPRG